MLGRYGLIEMKLDWVVNIGWGWLSYKRQYNIWRNIMLNGYRHQYMHAKASTDIMGPSTRVGIQGENPYPVQYL